MPKVLQTGKMSPKYFDGDLLPSVTGKKDFDYSDNQHSHQNMVWLNFKDSDAKSTHDFHKFSQTISKLLIETIMLKLKPSS